MMIPFVSVKLFKNKTFVFKVKNGELGLSSDDECVDIKILSYEGLNGHSVEVITLRRTSNSFDVSKKSIAFVECDKFVTFKFASPEDFFLSTTDVSAFDARTDTTSAVGYFQFYSFYSQQQNMLLDRIRTETYQFAIMRNSSDFRDKVVLDVGTGTGVLAFFAAFAGAKKVFAIEASNMAKCAKITDLPPVDIIISEAMGYMLFNERMIETFLFAKKWLAKGGKMFPSVADFFVVPFTDETVYQETYSKILFWSQKYFYGIDLSSQYEEAYKEYFSQPIVDTFDSRIFIAQPKFMRFDFQQLSPSDLETIVMDLEFDSFCTCVLHGVCTWFTVTFCGSEQIVTLSTAPDRPLTHWYQMRFLFPTPIFVQNGDKIRCVIEMVGNTSVLGQPSSVTQGVYDLKNCLLRYMNPAPPTVSNIIREPCPTPQQSDQPHF